MLPKKVGVHEIREMCAHLWSIYKKREKKASYGQCSCKRVLYVESRVSGLCFFQHAYRQVLPPGGRLWSRCCVCLGQWHTSNVLNWLNACTRWHCRAAGRICKIKHQWKKQFRIYIYTYTCISIYRERARIKWWSETGALDLVFWIWLRSVCRGRVGWGGG